MTNPIIEMSKIKYSFNNKPILNKVDISVKQGEIVGLIGPNGSGKTNLFYSIVGTNPIDNGSIKFNEKFLK